MPIAYNDKTGEALRLGDDGAWAPTKIAHNPQTGEMLALDGSQWVGIKKPEMGWGEHADNLVRQVANGATFGFADEISAGLNSLIGKGNYDDNLKAERDKDKAFEAANPVAATAAQIGGGLMTGGAGAGRAVAAQGLSLPAKVLRSSGVGAAAGGLAGFGAGEDGLENRATTAATGALTGGVVGAALPPVVAGLGKLGDALSPITEPIANRFRSGPQIADLKIAQAIERDKLTPEQVAQNLRDIGPNAALVDAGGENLSSLGRAAAGVPGEAKEKAAAFLNTRQEGQGARIVGKIERSLDTTADYHANADDLLARRAREAAPLYEAAYAKPFVWSDQISGLMDRPSMKQALGRAYRIAAEEGRDPQGLGLAMNEAGDVTFASVPSMRTLDFIKRGLDDVLEGYRDKTSGRLVLDEAGRAVNNTRAQLLRAIDDANPEYKAARAAYAGPSQSLDAMARGRDFIKSDAEVTTKQLVGLPDSDKEFFRAGAARALRDMIYNTDDGSNAVRRLFGNQMKRDKLAAVFPDEASFKEFERAMQSEALMYSTRAKVLGGSRTAPMQAELADLDSSGGLGSAASQAVRGNLLGAVGDLASTVMSRAQRPSERVGNALADMMFNSDPQATAAVLARLRAQPSVQNSLRRFLAGSRVGGGLATEGGLAIGSSSNSQNP